MDMITPKNRKYGKSFSSFGKLDYNRNRNCVGFGTATECYNFDMSSGALTAGYGVTSNVNLPQRALKAYTVKKKINGENRTHNLYLIDGNICVDSAATKLDDLQFDDFSVLQYRLNGSDTALISSKNHPLFSWDGVGDLNAHKSAPKIVDMALHYERLFAITSLESEVLRFSDDFDPTNWTESKTEGGFIEILDGFGDMLRVLSFGGYLYVFREYGIERIDAAGLQDDFSVKHLYKACGKIQSAGIAECGDRIVFSASDGLHCFDGAEVRKIATELPKIVNAKASAFFEGKYYLSCDVEKGGDVYDYLIVLDLLGASLSLSRGLDISFMSVIELDGETVLACRTPLGMGVIKKCGSYFESSLHKKWTGGAEKGASEKITTVQNVVINSSCPCLVTVNADENKTRAAKAGKNNLTFNAKAKNGFFLTVETDEKTPVILPPTVIYIE